jgi:hypothetical protein
MDEREPERIDLSPLDPAADPARWEDVIARTAARAQAARRAPGSFLAQLVSWGRPALGLAAALALVVWGASLLGGQPRRAPTRVDPAATLSRWAEGGAGADALLDALEGSR